MSHLSIATFVGVIVLEARVFQAITFFTLTLMEPNAGYVYLLVGVRQLAVGTADCDFSHERR